MKESGQTEERFPITYFDGINSTVQPTLSKRTELSHSENARSPQIGVLEKREGQVAMGLNSSDGKFVAASNYGLFYFNNDDANSQKVYRITEVAGVRDIYYLHTNGQWTKMSDTEAQTLTAANFDHASVDGRMVLVNGSGANRYIGKDGITVASSAEAGDLYNSPNANKVVHYKNRIHMADFTRSSVRYPTTILRSSFPLGIIALVDGDYGAGISTLNVTDTKYFYSASGVNTYDIYRGGTLIETITVTAVNETSIEVDTTTSAFLSSDEVWIGGTYAGEKQYRWVNNPTSTGRDVKQYDTFKLTGGDESPITLFETIGNVLMMGNRKTLAAWDDYTLQNIDLNIGCASSRGSVKMLGTLYFLDYNGIYGTTGGLPTLLSRKVERYIKGATKAGLENAAAGYKGLSVFFTIGDVALYKEDGSVDKTLPDVCLEYSAADQNWYVHTNVTYNEFVNFINADGQEQIWGASTHDDASVISFLTGDTDEGSEIFMRFDTQEIQLLKEFETHVSLLAIVTEVYRGSQLKAFVSLDRDQEYELKGTANKGTSILKIHNKDNKVISPPLCRKIKVSYRDSSKQRCRINQMAIVYTPTTIDIATE